jgi:membrane protease YdiL (CAAX protease family)
VLLDGIDPQFGIAGTVLALVLLAWLGLAVPFLGRRGYRRLVATGGRKPEARKRWYARTISAGWLFVGVAVIIVAVSPGVSLGDVGVAVPSGWRLWLTAGVTAYVVGALFVGWIRARRRLHSGQPIPGREALTAILPRTPTERRLAFWLAVTAGVGEEVVYRGLLIAVFVGILGWVPTLAAFASLAVFSLAHLYQGRKGMVQVTLVGFVITALYAISGSLAPGIIVHILLDLFSILFLPVGPTPPSEQTPAVSDKPTPTSIESPAAQIEQPPAIPSLPIRAAIPSSE